MSKTKALPKRKAQQPPTPLQRVHELYNELSKSVYGQDEAKRIVATAAALHLDRINSSIPTSKTNVLLVGPTGSGKTQIARTMADKLGCPFVIVDCTKLTPSGFIGDSVQSILEDLLDQVNGDTAQAEQSVVFLDEIDKICLSQSSSEGAYQLKKLQSELLKICEGSVYTLSRKKDPILGIKETVNLNTSSILFIAAGAFEGLFHTYKKQKRTLGIAESNDAAENETPHIDFVKAVCEFGMIPELIGRFPLIAQTKPLKKEDFRQILDNTSMFQTAGYYSKLFESENIRFTLSDDLKWYLAGKAVDVGSGVRGINGLIEERMVQLIFDLDNLRGKRIILEPDGYRITNEPSVRPLNKLVSWLSKNSIFAELNEDALTLFAKSGLIKKYNSGDIVMLEGDTSETVAILMKGSLRVRTKRGLNIVRNEIGTSFGEIGFLNGSNRTATVTAEQDSEVLELTTEQLTELIHDHPNIGVRVLQAFSKVGLSRAGTGEANWKI